MSHRKSEKKSNIRFVPKVKFNCACGKEVTAGNNGESGEPVLLHALPPCDDYVNMEAHEYLAKQNRLRFD